MDVRRENGKLRKTHIITEAAIQLALFAVLFLVSLYVPLLGMIAILFLSLPFMIFTMRHGYAYALLLLVASLIISTLIGSLLSLPVALMFGTAGIAIGGMLAKNKSRYMILLTSAFNSNRQFTLIFRACASNTAR